jgi:hypothetical protein
MIVAAFILQRSFLIPSSHPDLIDRQSFRLSGSLLPSLNNKLLLQLVN